MSIVGGARVSTNLYRFRCPKSSARPCRCVRGCRHAAAAAQNGQVLRRIFSGIQPTGTPHLGNYLGTIQHWVTLQQQFPSLIFSIVDLHAITVPQNPEKLGENILDMTACLLACGINPEKSILFQQSSIPQHTELAWNLGCLCTLPQLQHLPQWKEKSEHQREAGVGLFTYPILQAADILLYKATNIPIGNDQLKHIELTRHLAARFNKLFGNYFPKPEPLHSEFAKVKSLRNPHKKMSKSEADPRSRIDLTDSPDAIREKLKKAVTDSTSMVTYEPHSRPGVANLIDIHCACTDLNPDLACEQNVLSDTGHYKMVVADAVIEILKPIRENIERLQRDRSYLQNILKNGQDKAAAIAESTVRDVKKLSGLSLD